MKTFLFTFSIVVLFVSCKQDVKINAQEIIDKSITISGGDLFESSTISFYFRDKHYLAKRNKGKFLLMRIFEKESDSIFDALTNEGFERAINNINIQLADSMKVKYSASVNSVHYFSVLPYGLNDAAVNKEYLGKAKIKNVDYYKIKVFFNKDGGGEDFDDIYVYWINSKNFKVDYLAYSFHVNGGGMRFREAYNERYIKGLRFVDYNNYKPIEKEVNLLDLDELFNNDKLKLLSKIETENITVELINN